MQQLLVAWLVKYIEDTENPWQWGKALELDVKTLWCCRVGSFRLTVDIIDNEFVVLIPF